MRVRASSQPQRHRERRRLPERSAHPLAGEGGIRVPVVRPDELLAVAVSELQVSAAVDWPEGQRRGDPNVATTCCRSWPSRDGSALC